MRKNYITKIDRRNILSTDGELIVREKPFSLFDISMGLNLEATGIENIYIMGYLRGLSKNDIENRIDDIIEFSN